MSDDDTDNDPLLESMRPVWLSMRDEEPPAGGLAELMAAARTQAEVMKPKEPWWRRAFVVALRPPVLAAATVLVLVGGAVMINRHHDEMVTTPTVETRPAAAPPVAAPPAEVRTETTLETEKDTAAKLPEGGDTVVRPADPPPPPLHVAPRRDVPRPPPPPPVVAEKPKAHEDQQAQVKQTVEPPKPQGTTDVDTRVKTPAADPGGGELMIAGEDERPVVQGTTVPGVAPQRQTGAPTRGPADSVDQLVKQTEVAASRKDCPAVRAMAGRIKKLDATTYKARVASKPAIASCLR